MCVKCTMSGNIFCRDWRNVQWTTVCFCRLRKIKFTKYFGTSFGESLQKGLSNYASSRLLFSPHGLCLMRVCGTHSRGLNHIGGAGGDCLPSTNIYLGPNRGNLSDYQNLSWQFHLAHFKIRSIYENSLVAPWLGLSIFTAGAQVQSLV